jgi:hypothetical protein
LFSNSKLNTTGTHLGGISKERKPPTEKWENLPPSTQKIQKSELNKIKNIKLVEGTPTFMLFLQEANVEIGIYYKIFKDGDPRFSWCSLDRWQ